jgi:competence protein ComGC
MRSGKSNGGSIKRSRSQSCVSFPATHYNPSHPLDQRGAAFTRIELLTVLATVSLLIAIVIAPAWRATSPIPNGSVCFNNLRLIGRAVQMWAGDHNGNPPWRNITH